MVKLYQVTSDLDDPEGRLFYIKMPQYTVPQEFGGKNLYSLPGFGGRQDVLGQIIGVDPNSPLNAGYSFSLPYGIDPSSTEAQYVQSKFTQSQPGADAAKVLAGAYSQAEQTIAAGKPITEAAYTERGRQLEAEKQPLTARYEQLLTELTQRETTDIGQQTTALAREYGKRGIPLSSGAYEQDVIGKQTPIKQFYTNQRTGATFEREDKLRELGNLLADLPIQKAAELNQIDQKISELKISGADKQLQTALEQYRMEREDKWKQQELDLQKQSFQLQKYVAEKPEPVSYQAVQGPGDSIYSFNPSTGKFDIGIAATLKNQFGGDTSGDGRYSLD